MLGTAGLTMYKLCISLISWILCSHLEIYQEMYVRTVKSGPLPLTLQILDTAGKKRGRLTKPVSAELVICRGRLGSD